MKPEYFKRIFERDLEAVKLQLRAYETERQVWELPQGFRNSAGTLGLHLAGNVRHFVGHLLAGSGYVRDRDYEFGARGVSVTVICDNLDRAIEEMSTALDAMSDETLDRAFPGGFAGHDLPIGLVLTHLVTHLGYHLGQIDYHRRSVTGSSEPIQAGQNAILR